MRRDDTEVQVDAIGENLGEAFGDVLVEAAQQRVGPVEESDFRTEAGEHVAHLDSDEASTDNAEALR